MNKKATLLFCAMSLLFATSCSNMKQGVGLHGVVVNEEKMTLDGDTFCIRDRIGDKMLIVQEVAYKEGYPCYLISRESDGLYYIQAEEKGIKSIGDTERFVIFDSGEVFDTEKKNVLFRTACDLSLGFYYLGAYDDKFLFSNMDSLCFSDEKYIELQSDVLCNPVPGSNMVRLTLGAQSIDITPRELYLHIDKPIKNDSTILRFKKTYALIPPDKYVYGSAGYDVDLDIPLGNDTADIAIRQWINTQIRNEMFSLLETNPEEMPVSRCGSVEDMLQCLDLYSVVWEKILRNNYQVEDTLFAIFTSHIVTRKIVDCKDYVTYYFSTLPYFGGMHDFPRSYYATYDKRHNEFLKASNTVKKDSRKAFAEAALRSLKKRFDENREGESEWEDYSRLVFSFCSPLEGNDNISNFLDTVYGDLYYCDKDAEWQGKGTPYNISDFPLPHLAIIPEGMVVTYHPYQIDCFAAGEYHAVMPLKDIAGCLKYKYEQAPNNKRLDLFIKTRVD